MTAEKEYFLKIQSRLKEKKLYLEYYENPYLCVQVLLSNVFNNIV